MKALLLSHSNGGGGAGRATQRLFDALDSHTDTDLRMHVDFKQGIDPRVFNNEGLLWEKRRSLRITTEEIPAYVTRHGNPRLFSPGLVSAMTARRIDALQADVINVHWTNFGYLSIGNLAKITTPMVWTLHDMWAVTGGMNYEPEDLSQDTDHYAGIEKWVAQHKRSVWTKPFHVVTPSQWLANIVQRSELGRTWTVDVIPNPLDLELFAPRPARGNTGQGEPIRVIVSLGGAIGDPRKGFDLLIESLSQITSDIHLLVIGHSEPPSDWPRGLPPTTWLGYLNDAELVAAYASADMAIVPSRQDNLPQTATEPVACGLPVIAFNIGGIPEIVDHGVNGFLADPEDTRHLASLIDGLSQQPALRAEMSARGRDRAELLWSPQTVAARYQELFERLVHN